jgi:hypothetical protein
LNCTSKSFSCNFLDLAVKQILKVYPVISLTNVLNEGIEMIHMPHVHFNNSITAKLGVINSQFHRFLRLCSCKEFFVSQMVSFIVQLKNKGYPLKWRASCKPTWSLFFSAVHFCVFCISCCVFLFLSISLCLLLASSIAESSCCFQNCGRNSIGRLVFSLAFTHCRELMKSVRKL